MNQVLHHVIASRVPVHIRSLVSPECLKGLSQFITEGISNHGVRLDNGIAIRVKSGNQARKSKVLGLVAQLSNALEDHRQPKNPAIQRGQLYAHSQRPFPR